jgi:ATP-dependent DNA helicase RecG
LWGISNLWAILFAKRLDEFEGLQRKAPRVIFYEGKGKLHSRPEVIRSKGYAIDFEDLIAFINALLPAHEIIGKALRRDEKMFPEIAVREPIANALIHRDFEEMGPSVVVEIYSDRLEIRNPGIPSIPLERFIDEYQSRNEQLADIMRRLGMCEEKGQGIDKVIDAAEDSQLPAPDFRVGVRSTSAVLFAHKDFELMSRGERVRACYQHCCLRYVMNEPMTNQSLRERFNLPESKVVTVSQTIAATVGEGKIKPVEPYQTSKRYARYIPAWA